MNEEADIVRAMKEGLAIHFPSFHTWRITDILTSPIHRTASKGADVYEHKQDFWRLEDHFAQSV